MCKTIWGLVIKLVETLTPYRVELDEIQLKQKEKKPDKNQYNRRTEYSSIKMSTINIDEYGNNSMRKEKKGFCGMRRGGGREHHDRKKIYMEIHDQTL